MTQEFGYHCSFKIGHVHPQQFQAMPKFRARELYVALRNLLSWRVGAPGLDRSSLAAFEAYAKWDEQTPDTALRVLRALGRIDAFPCGKIVSLAEHDYDDVFLGTKRYPIDRHTISLNCVFFMLLEVSSNIKQIMVLLLFLIQVYSGPPS